MGKIAHLIMHVYFGDVSNFTPLYEKSGVCPSFPMLKKSEPEFSPPYYSHFIYP